MQSHSMLPVLLFIVLCVMLFAAVSYYKRKTQKKYFARKIMTAYEQKLFTKLKVALPQYHILSQVAFSALITNQNYKIRSQFNRKVTDFVVINDDGDVIAIIELDDSTHLDKVDEDKFRDLMLTQAGYKVVRFTKIPTLQEIRQRVSGTK